MSDQNRQPDRPTQHHFTAADAMAGGFLSLAIPVVRELGYPAQTLAALAGILKIDGASTFRPQAILARAAGVPLRTFRRHIRALEGAGLIKTAPGDTTNTYRLTKAAHRASRDGFYPAPRYSLELPWAPVVTYAYIVYRSIGGGPCTEPQRAMAKATGLTQMSVIRALDTLQDRGYIQRQEGPPGHPLTLWLLTPPKGDNILADPRSQNGRVGDNILADHVKDMVLKNQTKDHMASAKTSSKKTPMGHITTVDLADTARLLGLFRKATTGGLLCGSEHHRILWVGAAEHALRCGDQNPPGLFAWIVANESWDHVTSGDEDRAVKRLKAHDSAAMDSIVGAIGNLFKVP